LLRRTKDLRSSFDGSSFSESRASVKSIWTVRAADVGLRLANEILEEYRSRIRGDLRCGYNRLSADAEMTACFNGSSVSFGPPMRCGRRRVWPSANGITTPSAPDSSRRE
jgi:hypothetical protein